jgi:hypothetical protein
MEKVRVVIKHIFWRMARLFEIKPSLTGGFLQHPTLSHEKDKHNGPEL